MFEQFTFTPERVLTGLITGAVGVLFNTLTPLFVAVLAFEAVDFVTGCWKSFVVARRQGRKPAFESIKAWRTIYKVVFIFVGIVMAEILDALISEERLRLANFFTAFCCGVEFWSFLENASEISEHPVFRWVRRFMSEKIEAKTGEKIEKYEDKRDDSAH